MYVTQLCNKSEVSPYPNEDFNALSRTQMLSYNPTPV